MKKSQVLALAVSVVVLVAGCATDATRPVVHPLSGPPNKNATGAKIPANQSPAERLIELEKSLALYDKALQRDPDDPSLHNRRGGVLRNLGRYEEALAAYHEALRLDPGNAIFFTNRALTLHALGRL